MYQDLRGKMFQTAPLTRFLGAVLDLKPSIKLHIWEPFVVCCTACRGNPYLVMKMVGCIKTCRSGILNRFTTMTKFKKICQPNKMLRNVRFPGRCVHTSRSSLVVAGICRAAVRQIPTANHIYMDDTTRTVGMHVKMKTSPLWRLTSRPSWHIKCSHIHTWW